MVASVPIPLESIRAMSSASVRRPGGTVWPLCPSTTHSLRLSRGPWLKHRTGCVPHEAAALMAGWSPLGVGQAVCFPSISRKYRYPGSCASQPQPPAMRAAG
eukprot:scaffold2910_cov390-Prasinococcus_capsulatus_cf.AAC.38